MKILLCQRSGQNCSGNRGCPRKKVLIKSYNLVGLESTKKDILTLQIAENLICIMQFGQYLIAKRNFTNIDREIAMIIAIYSFTQTLWQF